MFCFSWSKNKKRMINFVPNCGVNLSSNSTQESKIRTDKGRLLDSNISIDDRSNHKI